MQKRIWFTLVLQWDICACFNEHNRSILAQYLKEQLEVCRQHLLCRIRTKGYSYSAAHLISSRGTPVAEHCPRPYSDCCDVVYHVKQGNKFPILDSLQKHLMKFRSKKYFKHFNAIFRKWQKKVQLCTMPFQPFRHSSITIQDCISYYEYN